MSDPLHLLKDALKKQGYSVTSPRQAVFKQLLGKEPLSMHELVLQTSSVDRASVYRTVALFEELGIIIRVNIGWKYKVELSEMFSTHHHHMSCTNCERTIALDEASIEQAIEALCRDKQFMPTAHQIEIQGLCRDCQAKAAIV